MKEIEEERKHYKQEYKKMRQELGIQRDAQSYERSPYKADFSYQEERHMGLYEVLAEPKVYLKGRSSLNQESLGGYQSRRSTTNQNLRLEDSFMRDRFAEYSQELKNKRD